MMDLRSVGCFMLKIKLVYVVKSQVQQFELPTRLCCTMIPIGINTNDFNAFKPNSSLG